MISQDSWAGPVDGLRRHQVSMLLTFYFLIDMFLDQFINFPFRQQFKKIHQIELTYPYGLFQDLASAFSLQN